MATAGGTSIAFHGGMNEIGGNKFLIEDKGTRVFLDFGMQMGLHGKYYDLMMKPRTGCALSDLFEFGLLPRIHGIYRQDHTEHLAKGLDPDGWFKKDSKSEDSVHGVLLTHAHVDHCEYIRYMRPDIPIYCTEATRIIMQALQDTGSESKHFTTYKEELTTYTNKKGDTSWIEHSRNREERGRNIVPVEPYKKYKIDSIEFEPLPVDHSLPGACGFMIHTSAGSIAYTGDLRFHGRHKKKTERFVDTCGSEKPDYMLCEGTRVDVGSSPTEESVKEDAADIMLNTKGLSVVSYPVRDLDRFLSLYNAAVRSGREMLIDFKQAYLLRLFESSEESKGAYPRLDDPNIKVFLPRMGKCLAGAEKGTWDDKLLMKDYSDQWKKDLIDSVAGQATHADVRAAQKKYVLYCSDWNLQQLIDVKPEEGSSYIHSSTEPFSDEMELDHNRIKRWLHHFGLIKDEGSWTSLHVSGHGTGDQIEKVVRGSNAKKLIPIHTELGNRFEHWHDGVIYGENGGRVEI